MNVPLKRYQKDFAHSYAFGVFPTLELLHARPEHVLKVLLHSRGAANHGVARIQALCAERRVPVEVNDRAVERLAAKESHYAVGVFAKYRETLAPDANQVVLVQPGDMGNLGTIARTLLGFGVDQLALIRPAVDAFDPRAVRASMGALFQLAFAYYDSFDAYRRANGERGIYSLMSDGLSELDDVVFERPWSLVFGNESSGLSADYHHLGTSVRIPMTRRVDSLSLPVAVAVALYVAGRTAL